MHIQYTPGMIPLFERFATLACAWQAEQDAAICDNKHMTPSGPADCAAAIRANAPKVTT